MKKFYKEVLKYTLIFGLLIILYISLLYVASLFPSSKIKENVQKSAEILVVETEYSQKTFLGRQIPADNYTDSLMINNAYSIDNHDPLYSALIVRRNYNPSITRETLTDEIGEPETTNINYISETQSLYKIANDDIFTAKEYAKYWHGYLILLRPLLLIFSYPQIRIFQSCILLLLSLWLLIELSKKINKKTAIFFAIALLCVDFEIIIQYNMENSIMFYITFISSIILIKRYHKIKDIKKFFFILGSITCFFDFLTTPILGLGMSLIIYFLLKQKEENLNMKEILKIFIFNCIIWALGYSLTWITKFLIVDLLYKKNILYIGISQVLHRTRTLDMNEGNEITYSYKYSNVLFANFIRINITILGLAIVRNYLEFIKISKNYKEYYINIARCIPYILVSLLPFVWFLALRQHSYMHSYFTYRSLLITIMCIFIIMDLLFYKKNCLPIRNSPSLEKPKNLNKENNNMDNLIELTILMPCLNEEKTVGLCIDCAKKFITRNNINGEILISDNMSSDNSVKIANEHGARVVTATTKGYGATLINGINEAKGKYVIFADSDMSYDFENLELFYEKLSQDYDLVMGNRFKGKIEKGAMPFSHKIGVPILSILGKIISKAPVNDFHCGLRGLNREKALSLSLETEGMEFATEIIFKFARAGYSITEVPITLRKDKRNRKPHLRTIKDRITTFKIYVGKY